MQAAQQSNGSHKVISNQEQFTEDCLNLIGTLICHTLYCRKVYPEQVFSPVNVYGLRVQAFKNGIMDDYITNFLNNLKSIFDSLQTVKIVLKNDTSIIENVDIEIEKQIQLSNIDNLPSKTEREFAFKKIIYEFDQKLQKIPTKLDKVENTQLNIFQIEILSNGSEITNTQMKSQLLQNWVLDNVLNQQQQQKQQSDQNQKNDKNYQLLGQAIYPQFQISVFINL